MVQVVVWNHEYIWNDTCIGNETYVSSKKEQPLIIGTHVNDLVGIAPTEGHLDGAEKAIEVAGNGTHLG